MESFLLKFHFMQACMQTNSWRIRCTLDSIEAQGQNFEYRIINLDVEI